VGKEWGGSDSVVRKIIKKEENRRVLVEVKENFNSIMQRAFRGELF